MNDARKIVYKKVKVSMPHCNVCGERLRGENNMVLPYQCKCGVWGYEHDWKNLAKTNYFIKKPKAS